MTPALLIRRKVLDVNAWASFPHRRAPLSTKHGDHGAGGPRAAAGLEPGERAACGRRVHRRPVVLLQELPLGAQWRAPGAPHRPLGGRAGGQAGAQPLELGQGHARVEVPRGREDGPRDVLELRQLSVRWSGIGQSLRVGRQDRRAGDGVRRPLQARVSAGAHVGRLAPGHGRRGRAGARLEAGGLAGRTGRCVELPAGSDASGELHGPRAAGHLAARRSRWRQRPHLHVVVGPHLQDLVAQLIAVSVQCVVPVIYALDLNAAATAATTATARVASVSTGPASASGANASPWGPEALLPDSFEGHETSVTTLQIHASGAFLVSGDESGAVHVWDSLSRQSLRNIKLFKGKVTALVLLPRPRHLFRQAKTAFTMESEDPDDMLATPLPVAPLKKYMNATNDN
ncbi:hypothetical protein ON010_g917 [Phytophthora cinnamomi]|nr:hypothetical protein ON010_g917 [Phytophthora cinnamomi]